MTEMLRYYDMDGQPISAMKWAELYEDFAGRTLGRDEVDTPDGRRIVITVWSGIREPEQIRSLLGDDDDLFGTALLRADGRFLREIATYPTKEAALDGHRKAVQAQQTPSPQ